MSGANNSLMIIAPGLVVALTALVVLAFDMLVGKKGILAWVASAGLLGAGGIAVGQGLGIGATTELGRGGPELGFAGMVALDRYTVFCTVLFVAIGIVTIMLSDGYLARRNVARGEFYALLLFVVCGMIGMAVSTDLIAFFVSFELMSLPTYVLAGSARGQLRSSEAALKYFVTGAFSSAILAFGMALIYAASGQTNYNAIAEALAASAGGGRGLLVVALILFVTGFGFKISAVPFHGWAPDVYEGAPTPVTAFMSTAVKAAAFVGFAKVFLIAIDSEWPIWGNALIILAIATMIVGNLLAIPQRNLKRMLAYSSIAHAGYLTLGLIAAGRSAADLGLAAILFYLAAYALMNLGAFGVLIWIRQRGPYAYSLDEIAGLGKRMPLVAILMTIFMVSLTGIPPLVGFWGKVYLFAGVIGGNYTWLVIVAVIMSAVSAYYYLRVVWFMYFREAPEVDAGEAQRGLTAADVAAAQAEAPATVAADGPLPVTADDGPPLGAPAAVILSALGVVLVGLFPQPLLDAAEKAVRFIIGG